jgi:hypothetical protein
MLEEQFRPHVGDARVFNLTLSDSALSAAYCGAMALVYPSRYEGFGMPVAEALACGCRVIACRNSAIGEVAEDAPIYVGEDDVAGLMRALEAVQTENMRTALLADGRAKVAAQFSWPATAANVARTLAEGVQRLQAGTLSGPAPMWPMLRSIQEESQERAAKGDLLHEIQRSRLWKLRAFVLRTLRPFGVRRPILQGLPDDPVPVDPITSDPITSAVAPISGSCGETRTFPR